MPVGGLKNTIYGAALPIVGKRCEWSASSAVEKVLKRHHAVGAAVQFFEKGKLTKLHTAGYARLGDQKRSVAPDTFFRTASIAKTVTALLVFRLQTLKRLDVNEEVSDFLGYAVRAQHIPENPIPLHSHPDA